MTPAFLTGLITTFFLYWMVSFGIGQLMDIQVPPYQLKYDEKNKDNNRDWSKIWGNLEKWAHVSTNPGGPPAVQTTAQYDYRSNNPTRICLLTPTLVF